MYILGLREHTGGRASLPFLGAAVVRRRVRTEEELPLAVDNGVK